MKPCEFMKKVKKPTHRYLVTCWIYPQSGFDIARKNKINALFREAMEHHFREENYVMGYLQKMEKEHEGKILEPFVLESDEAVKDAEKDLMPEILKRHPEAEYFSSEILPDFE